MEKIPNEGIRIGQAKQVQLLTKGSNELFKKIGSEDKSRFFFLDIKLIRTDTNFEP